MSLLSSILPRASSSRPRSSGRSPGHRIGEPGQDETTWQPPASISANSAATSRTPTGRSIGGELASLARHEADLQQYLQELLDAQAAALLAGVGNEGESEKSETASVTSSSSSRQQEAWNLPYRDQEAAFGTISTSLRSMHASSNLGSSPANQNNTGGVIPVRQPRPQAMSLRAARREIRQTMLSLSATKQQERKLLRRGITGREESIGWISSWKSKQEGLQKEMESIRSTQVGGRMQQLEQENESLKEQIDALEIQLAELKSQQRATVHELSTLENSVQAKLSSYQGSLAMLDREIKAFMKQPPADAGALALGRSSSSEKGQKTEGVQCVWELPASRRTPEMVLEQMERDKAALRMREGSTDDEIAALRDGAQLWEQTVRQVTAFERALQQQLRRSPGASGAETAAGRIVQQLEEVIEQVEEAQQTAEQRGWNLLICCIGAELEALRQGHEILVSASDGGGGGASQSSSATIQPVVASEHLGHQDERAAHRPSASGNDDDDDGPSPHKMSLSKSTTVAATTSVATPAFASISAASSSTSLPSSSRYMLKEDDEPDPDLLVSTTPDEF